MYEFTLYDHLADAPMGYYCVDACVGHMMHTHTHTHSIFHFSSVSS